MSALKAAPTPAGNLELASRLVKAGDDHAKALRGVMVWYQMECQVDTYRANKLRIDYEIV